jgi:predicted ATPase/class 3 adenylate cyclase
MPVFFFTDIEGSTRLWEEHTGEMSAVIARHDAILREQVSNSGGRITKHTGDGITASFEHGDPVTCALETQVRFGREDWGAIGELRIRIGLHAGEAEWLGAPGSPGGDYYGPPVNCSARIMAAAWGGQILLTPEVTSVSRIPPRATLEDLGQHLLKNVSAPQQIYQLDHPDLPWHEFPPLRTISGQSICRAVDQQGAEIAHLSGVQMAVALVTYTLLPALLGSLLPGSLALAGNLGVLQDLGAEALAEFLSEFAGHLRVKEPEEIRQQLETELQQRWATSAVLRLSASRLLQAVQGVDAAMAAATSELRKVLAQGLADLGSQFSEFHWMLGDLKATLAEIRSRQELQLALQREQLAKTEEMLQLQRDQRPVGLPAPRQQPQTRHNLPAQPTPFIGRQAQLAAVQKALGRPEVRLLTLTGPGGTGKTRLALQAAGEMVGEFEDGVFFVALAPIRDPAFLLPAIGQTLGIRETTDRPLLEQLADELHDRRALLVLDNFEQIVDAAPQVSDLLRAAPLLKALVTSRTLLRVYGEHSYPVPPMALPEPPELPDLERLRQAEAVQLFTQRARAVKQGFVLSDENVIAVIGICTRLDGLPLSIELAAARVRLLPPQAILTRLADRFRFLTAGPRDLPARHQTLRAAIDWSYDLLEAEEKALFRQLAVFVGGCSLEAAEAVCNGFGELDVLDGLQGLVDKNLAQCSEVQGEPRLVMLETIREYALEQLAASGGDEAEDMRRRHASFCVALAEEAEGELWGADRAAWLDRLDLEHDNLRAALEWSLQRGDADPGAADIGLRLAGPLWMFWSERAYLNEGRRWLERALACPLGQGSPRAKVLVGAGAMAWQLGDYAEARSYFEQGIAGWREAGDKAGLAEALHLGGHLALDEGEHDEARAHFEESLRLYQEMGEASISLVLTQDLALLTYHQGAFEEARVQFEAGLAAAQELGQKDLASATLNRLGELARLRGENEEAADMFEEGLALSREVQLKAEIPSFLKNLGHVARRRGDCEQARTLFAESLALQQEYGNKQGMAESLAGLASVAAQPECAARLFAAVETLLDVVGVPLSPADRVDLDRSLAAVRAQLDQGAFAAAWTEGQALAADASPAAWEQTIACALEA